MDSRCRVVTTALNRRFFPTVEGNRKYALGLLEQAVRLKPDLICLSEGFPTVSIARKDARDYAEPLDGPTLHAVGQVARKHRCYIICPLITEHDGGVWNSGVLLDRKGVIAGVYDKVWPVTTTTDFTRLEDGMTPGSENRVFDCDFGRIGMQICFDINFPEDWRELGEKGARLVVWPSAYAGGFPLRAYACVHQYFVVSAVRSGRSCIIDPCGGIRAHTDDRTELAWQDINLDFVVAHYDFNYAVPERIRAKYGERVSVRSYGEDELFLVEPRAKGLTTKKLLKEFEFESNPSFAQHHRVAAPALREGRTPAPQRFAFGGRPHWGK